MGTTENTVYCGISLFLLLFCVVVIVFGIIKIHELPGIIAKKRNHPQADAIQISSILGLLLLPLWFFALIWAYTKPFVKTAATDNDKEMEKGEQL